MLFFVLLNAECSTEQPGKDDAMSQLKSARFISQIAPEVCRRSSNRLGLIEYGNYGGRRGMHDHWRWT